MRRKMDPNTGPHILIEPARSRCTWACHKRHFVRKFAENMANAPDTTSIEHWAVPLTVRAPSVSPHCLGNKLSKKWHIKVYK